MICLLPDTKISERYSTVDFDVLSKVCSIYYDAINEKDTKKHKIHLNGLDKDKAGDDLCTYISKNRHISINMVTNLKNDNVFLKYFLHEYRHFIQDIAFKLKFDDINYDDSTKFSYINSPLEVDVRYFVRENKRYFLKLYHDMLKEKHRIKNAKFTLKFNGTKIVKNES